MSKIVRWDPMREAMNLFNEFDRVFEMPRTAWEGARRSAAETPAPTYWGVAVDVVESEGHYTVQASLPGVKAEDLDITVEDNVLTIQGEVKSDEKLSEGNYHVRERRYGNFSRSLRFPVAVNPEAIEANMDNGVLTVTVPKAEEVKPKRIAVKAG